MLGAVGMARDANENIVVLVVMHADAVLLQLMGYSPSLPTIGAEPHLASSSHSIWLRILSYAVTTIPPSISARLFYLRRV
jgi:hypothetical protein